MMDSDLQQWLDDNSRKRRRKWRKLLIERRRRVMLSLMLIIMGTTIEQRRLWSKPRSDGFWNIVMKTFTDIDWKENFRMSKSTFQYICQKLRRRLQRQNTVLRASVSVEKRVAITIWRLATNVEFRTIGHLFGVGRSTACTITHDTCSAIVKVFGKSVISFPKDNALRDVIDGFENKFNFPQCAGAIDGTHIPILAPREYAADYYNRKGWHSVILQAVCDHLYRFTDLTFGWPGRVHDARVFANSIIFRKGQEGSLFPRETRNVGGVEVPILLLGDPAYPLLPWVMKGFSDNGRLTRQQHNFNTRLSSARMVIECAFGRLKGRWRCLLKRNDSSQENLSNVVMSCCILHNICELREDAPLDEWIERARQDDVFQPGEENVEIAATGQEIRSALVNYVNTQD